MTGSPRSFISSHSHDYQWNVNDSESLTLVWITSTDHGRCHHAHWKPDSYFDHLRFTFQFVHRNYSSNWCEFWGRTFYRLLAINVNIFEETKNVKVKKIELCPFLMIEQNNLRLTFTQIGWTFLKGYQNTIAWIFSRTEQFSKSILQLNLLFVWIQTWCRHLWHMARGKKIRFELMKPSSTSPSR